MSLGLVLGACATESPDNADNNDEESGAISSKVVEASCGQCQFGLPGSGCDLAVAWGGRAYYVDGSHIDDHGDAHAPNGMCNAVLKARVSGTLLDDRFQATEFEVVTEDAS